MIGYWLLIKNGFQHTWYLKFLNKTKSFDSIIRISQNSSKLAIVENNSKIVEKYPERKLLQIYCTQKRFMILPILLNFQVWDSELCLKFQSILIWGCFKGMVIGSNQTKFYNLTNYKAYYDKFLRQRRRKNLYIDCDHPKFWYANIFPKNSLVIMNT